MGFPFICGFRLPTQILLDIHLHCVYLYHCLHRSLSFNYHRFLLPLYSTIGLFNCQKKAMPIAYIINPALIPKIKDGNHPKRNHQINPSNGASISSCFCQCSFECFIKPILFTSLLELSIQSNPFFSYKVFHSLDCVVYTSFPLYQRCDANLL